MPVATWDKYASAELIWDRYGRPEWPSNVSTSAVPSAGRLRKGTRAARIINNGRLLAQPTEGQLAKARKTGRGSWLGQILHAAGCYAFFAPVTGAVKIGISSNIRKRWTELECSAGIPLQLVSVWKFDRYDQVQQMEKRLHTLFDEDRRLGEWFAADAVLPVLLSDEILT